MLCECAIGQAVELTVAFVDLNNQPADPTTAIVRVHDPHTKTATDYTGGQLTHAGPGIYKVVVTFTKSGRWPVKGVGTGAVVAATPDDFVLVSETVFP